MYMLYWQKFLYFYKFGLPTVCRRTVKRVLFETGIKMRC